MRVGDRTDYNRLKLEVETDGSISPSQALHKAAHILRDHFDVAGGLEVQETVVPSASGEKSAKGTAKKSVKSKAK